MDDTKHKAKIIDFLTKYLGINPETHISPLAKKLIALSIAFGVITAILMIIDNNQLRAQLKFPDEAEKQYQAMRRIIFGPTHITDDDKVKCFDEKGRRIFGPCPMLLPRDED